MMSTAASRRAHSSMSARATAAGGRAGAISAAAGGIAGGGGGVNHATGTRSWHPSPFASDDEISNPAEEPQFFKEEKKNRIKMEIARRRQQIEENACLHEELTRLAKLRESAELTGAGGVVPSTVVNPAASRGFVTSADGATSVLKSVDEILRDGGDASGYRTRTRDILAATAGDPHHSHVMAGGGGVFNSDLYGTSAYDRVTDFSPINSDLSDFNAGRVGATGAFRGGMGVSAATAGGLMDGGDPYAYSGAGKYSHKLGGAFK